MGTVSPLAILPSLLSHGVGRDGKASAPQLLLDLEEPFTELTVTHFLPFQEVFTIPVPILQMRKWRLTACPTLHLHLFLVLANTGAQNNRNLPSSSSGGHKSEILFCHFSFCPGSCPGLVAASLHLCLCLHRASPMSLSASSPSHLNLGCGQLKMHPFKTSAKVTLLIWTHSWDPCRYLFWGMESSIELTTVAKSWSNVNPDGTAKPRYLTAG